MLFRLPKREDLDRTASKLSDLDLHYLSRPFWYATSVRNLRENLL